jgi:hypothetical protein
MVMIDLWGHLHLTNPRKMTPRFPRPQPGSIQGSQLVKARSSLPSNMLGHEKTKEGVDLGGAARGSKDS